MTEQSRRGMSAGLRQLVVGACVLGGLVLTGALLGYLWWELTPTRAEGTVLGDGEVFTGTSEDLFAGEGYFVLITAVAGLVTGYGAYMVQFPLSRRRVQDLRFAVLIAGVLGSAAASVLTWQVGSALDGPLHAAVAAAEPGDTVTVGLQLKATAFLVAWPFVFVLQYGLLDAISLVRRDQPGTERPDADPDPDAGSEPLGEGTDTGAPSQDAPVSADRDPGGPGDTSR